MHVAWRDDHSISGRGLPSLSITSEYLGLTDMSLSHIVGSAARMHVVLICVEQKVDYPTPRSLSRHDFPILASTILCSPRSPPLL